MLTRGMLIGDLLFAAWFGVTVSESMLSDIMRVSLIANKSVFFIRCLLWLAFCLLLGFVWADRLWKRKEDKFNHLS